MPTADTSRARRTGIDYDRLYDFRFRHVDQTQREQVWREIAGFLHRQLGEPRRVLDGAAGRGEFINSVPAPERWAVDAVDHPELHRDPEVRTVIGELEDVDLPSAHFDGVLLSNVLEHFASQEDVGAILGRVRESMLPGGRIAILGPNFRYCAKLYFDCADHTLALTHISVEEHLYAAGYRLERVVPRFLPYSFRGRFPTGRRMVRLYLRSPLAWRVLGKQFLVIATNPLTAEH